MAPPTPEKLEQDKKSIEDQFDKAFSLVEQLSKDTETLKEAEKQRTERLDATLSELETVMADLKSANRRREDDAQRIRDEVQALKDAIPKAMNNQKDLTDTRLSEINTELTSLKTLVSQRMTSSTPTPVTSSYLRASGSSSTPTLTPTAAAIGTTSSSTTENATESSSTPVNEAPKPLVQSNFSRGASSGGKASIPAWQMAMAGQTAAAPAASVADVDDANDGQKGAASSSSS